MSVVTYCKCRIRFLSDDRSQQRNYSERSLIELRQHEFPDHAIRATDVEHGKQEIFNIPVREDNRYNFGRTVDDADEIRGANGSYQIWLERDNRDAFHTALQTCFEMLGIKLETSPEFDRPIRGGGDPAPAPTSNTESDNILVDINRLGEFISNGNQEEAVRIAKKLAERKIRLQMGNGANGRSETPFSVRIQIDSNGRGINGLLKMDVYPSTTVRELRAAVGYSQDRIPLNDQYWFVNGHLAYENSTMADLNAQNDTLFVLFVVRS